MPSSVRRHYWSSASILRASVLDIAKQSEPCRNIGKMHVLYSFSFVEMASRDLQIWFSKLCTLNLTLWLAVSEILQLSVSLHRLCYPQVQNSLSITVNCTRSVYVIWESTNDLITIITVMIKNVNSTVKMNVPMHWTMYWQLWDFRTTSRSIMILLLSSSLLERRICWTHSTYCL